MLLVVCCGFKLRGGFGSEMLTQDLDLLRVILLSVKVGLSVSLPFMPI